MNLNFKENLPSYFSDDAKVWIYQSNRPFSPDEALKIKDILGHFVTSWKSHGVAVKGYAGLFFEHFIILMADENQSTVSGCSTDSSIHVIKEIEKKFDIHLFDRQQLAFVIKNTIQLFELSQLDIILKNNIIDINTLYFNNTVLTKRELINKWIVSVNESWLTKRISLSK